MVKGEGMIREKKGRPEMKVGKGRILSGRIDKGIG